MSKIIKIIGACLIMFILIFTFSKNMKPSTKTNVSSFNNKLKLNSLIHSKNSTHKTYLTEKGNLLYVTKKDIRVLNLNTLLETILYSVKENYSTCFINYCNDNIYVLLGESTIIKIDEDRLQCKEIKLSDENKLYNAYNFVYNDKIISADGKSKIKLIDLDSGKSKVKTIPTYKESIVFDNRLICYGSNGNLYAYDTKDISRAWICTVNEPTDKKQEIKRLNNKIIYIAEEQVKQIGLKVGFQSYSQPYLRENVFISKGIYFYDEGAILEADLVNNWVLKVYESNPILSLHNINDSIVVYDKVDNNIKSYNIESCEIEWENYFSQTGLAELKSYRDLYIVKSNNNYIHVLRSSDGTELWRFNDIKPKDKVEFYIYNHYLVINNTRDIQVFELNNIN